jgi:lysozyme
MTGRPLYDRAALEKELVRDEGERLKVYRCTAGKLSIGVGRNLEDVGIRATEEVCLGLTKLRCIDQGISRAESRALLANDIAECEAALDRKLPWWRNLGPVRQRVLLNMCFNMGIATLLTFRNTLRFVRAGDYQRAADNMLASKWRRQVGDRAVRLATMMRTGQC